MAEEEKGKGRTIAPWRPISELSQFEREMEKMFGDFWGRPRFGWPRRWPFLEKEALKTPAIDIYEDKDNVVVKAELPGMRKEDLEVSVSENLLTITGEKKKEEKIDEKGYHYSERSFGRFTRTVEIPKAVKTDKVQASFKDGVLEIRLPKTEEPKRKEISIRVE